MEKNEKIKQAISHDVNTIILNRILEEAERQRKALASINLAIWILALGLLVPILLLLR